MTYELIELLLDQSLNINLKKHYSRMWQIKNRENINKVLEEFFTIPGTPMIQKLEAIAFKYELNHNFSIFRMFTSNKIINFPLYNSLNSFDTLHNHLFVRWNETALAFAFIVY